MFPNSQAAQLPYLGAMVAVLVGLYLSSLHSYLLFHSLIEFVTIAVAFTLFIVTWNTRDYLKNGYLRLLGLGYGFIALIDLVHTLAYKGMGVFPGYDANLPTQLWIAARYLQAITLLSAPLFIERRINDHVVFAVYTAAVAILLAAVFAGAFPDCFVEGHGLTAFKIGSEYAISALLLVALYLFHRQRRHFHGRVYALAAASIVCTVLSEISFTAYVSVYGFANLFGHFAKLAAFYLIYRAILVTGFTEPFDLVFRDLMQAQRALRAYQDTLEERVRERTAELRASEEKYRTLIESANDAVFIHAINADGTPGPFIEVNEVACRHLGYSREELARLSPMELDDPRYRDRIAEAMGQLQREGHAVFETAQIAKDGRSIPVEVSTRLLDLGGRRLLFSLVRDISERKRSEEALRRMNRELRAISSCNQTLLRTEDEQALLDAICRIVCEEAGYRLAWVGYAEQDEAKSIRPAAWAGKEEGYLALAKLTWADTERGRGPSGTAIRNGQCAWIQDFATDPRAKAWREEALRRGFRSSIGLPLQDGNGHAFGVLCIYSADIGAFTPTERHLLEELAGDLAFGVTTLRARSERRQVELRFHASERAFRAVVENSPDVIVRYDREGRRIFVNPEFERVNRLTAEQVIGKKPAELSTELAPMADVFTEKLMAAMASGSVSRIDLAWTKDGKPICWFIRVVPEFDADGHVVSALTIWSDITERKQAEEEIRSLNQDLERRVADRTAQLEAANKELEAFAYSVSHDLRTPLRHVDGFLSLLGEKVQPCLDDEGRQYMATISRAARRMGMLIDDLLSFSRMGRSEMSREQVDLAALVQDVIRDSEPETRGRSVRWRVGELPTVSADQAMLRVVLANLISNALKFTQPRPQAEIEIGCLPGEAETTVFVRDNGVGFDMQYVDKLFGVFQRLHRTNEFEGTGIGLANVRQVVNRHGGRTWAEGKIDGGATFYFSLPR